MAATVKATKQDNKIVQCVMDVETFYTPLNVGLLTLA
jgi:hypothetical protein